ncbi:MAG: Crp/Fnr family transcriptional regulator [Bacteroidetes bacterium]|nr:Crp/Fnr family transcriptional regulator [Bacteroidota bacterium]
MTVINKYDCVLCKDKSCAVAILTPDELKLLTGNCSEVELKRGDTIFKAGSLTTHIVYLKTGLVKESLIGSNKKEQIIQLIKAHSYLGLSSMLGYKTNHYSYKALEDLRVCYIDSTVFKQLVQSNGKFAFEILVSVSRENLNNYHRCVNKSLKQMYGRFADAMLYFSQVIYESNTFDLPITQNDLAALTATTRESITRTFTKFKNEGIIELNGKTITILKMDLLENISKTG